MRFRASFLGIIQIDVKFQNKKDSNVVGTIKELEQECYSLQKKLEGHQNMQATYQDELDSLQAESAVCEKRLRDRFCGRRFGMERKVFR